MRLKTSTIQPAVLGPNAHGIRRTQITMPTERPKAGEYNPYYDKYISLIPGTDVVGTLASQLPKTVALLSSLSEQDGDLRYAPGKWSLKEALGHVIDTERIMAYRALRIARGDNTPLAGFEQDDYVRNGPHSTIRLSDLVEEFKRVRAATIALFRNLREEDWKRQGVANKNDITVRALAYIIAGHELHHRNILEERYLGRQVRAEIA
jgi:hypothetical protein